MITAAIAGAIGSVGAILLNNFFNREKLRAEVGKILAETDKLRAEISGLSATVAYGLPNTTEIIVFDGRKKVDGFDIKGIEGSLWRNKKPSTPKGHGSLAFEEGGILNVQRSDTNGRFELWLRRYTYAGRDHERIPISSSIAGKRKLRISCEAKTIGAAHTLRFMIREPVNATRFSEDVKQISQNEWVAIEVFLQGDPTVETEVRIDDEGVTAAPSSLQIRNLLIVERQA
jgi:hypothetical protein